MHITRREFLREIGAAGAFALAGPGLIAAEAKAAEAAGIAVASEEQVLWRKAGASADSPVLASDGKSVVLALWLSRIEGDRELVMGCENRGKWSEPIPITPRAGKYEMPCLAHGRGSDAMAAWIRIDGADWSPEYTIYSDGKFGAPRPVDCGAGRACNPSLAAGADSSYWLVWERYARGRFTVCLVRYADGKWGLPIEITDGKASAYDPAVAVDASGKVWIAYSASEQGDRNLYLTSYDPSSGGRGPVVPVAVGGQTSAGPMVNSQPSLWVDGDNRAWIAYQHCASQRKTMSYHGRMNCSVVCFADGQLYQVSAKSPDHLDKTIFADANDQLPTIAADSSGRPWVFTRNSLEARRAWSVRASFLDGARGWTPAASPLEGATFGRIGRPAVAALGDSFWIAWQADNYLAGRPPAVEVTSEIRVAQIKTPEPSAPSGSVVLEPAAPGEPNKRRPGRARVLRRQMRAGGEEFTLLYGNLHEHTLISRCWADGSDGTFDDNYRHGVGVEGYDFMALTDHGYDLYETAWRRSRRAAEFYNDPPYFIALQAYEWTFSGPDKPAGSGHRNVIFGSDRDAARFLWEGKSVYDRHVEVSNRVDKLWNLLRDAKISAVTIPHHPADKAHPMDWGFHDPEFQRVVEIFQCRASAEHAGCPRETRNLTEHKGCYVQDALARGYRMGIIASGDHNAMGVGVAALWVREISRKGILEALRARRCYGTTGDKIFVDFRIDGRLMGEETVSSGNPRITAEVRGTSRLVEAVVFRNNDALLRKGESDFESSNVLRLDFTDDAFSEDSYYYLRIMQNNNEIAWSSPIWVTRA